MNEPTVTGVVHLIEATKTFGAKGFRKRLVVLEQDNGRFVNYVPIEFIQDGCDQVDELRVGDEIDVVYRLSGRKWQKDPRSEVKFFLSAEGLRFNKLGSGKKSPPAADPNRAFSEATDGAFDDGDVPF